MPAFGVVGRGGQHLPGRVQSKDKTLCWPHIAPNGLPSNQLLGPGGNKPAHPGWSGDRSWKEKRSRWRRGMTSQPLSCFLYSHQGLQAPPVHTGPCVARSPHHNPSNTQYVWNIS